jgi:hypothetical protein
MLNTSRYRVQKIELLKKNQPDLLDTLRYFLPSSSDEVVGKIAGLIMEYVIQSGGNVDIFAGSGALEDSEEY